MNFNLRQNLPTDKYAEYQKGKDILKSLSMYSSPNKPSSKGYSAEDIKRKMYEPILQLYDWLYNIKIQLESLIESKYQSFVLDISAGLVFDFKGNKAKFNLFLTKEQMETIQNYLSYSSMREFYLIINSQFFVVHAAVRPEVAIYKIYGFAIDLSTDFFANVALTIDRQTYECDGTLTKNLTEDYVTGQIDLAKASILETIAKDYVPKKDVNTIDSMSYGEVVYTPLTENGFVSIKTYNK